MNVSRETSEPYGCPEPMANEWIGIMEIPYSYMLTELPSWDGGAVKNEGGTARMGFVILMKCRCGRIGSLADHHVDDDGIVTPSVVCMDNECGFHENVILDGWDVMKLMDAGNDIP